MNYLKVRNTHSWFYHLKNSSCGLICSRFLKYSRVHVVPLEVMPPINPFFPRGTYWDFFLDLDKNFSSHYFLVAFYSCIPLFNILPCNNSVSLLTCWHKDRNCIVKWGKQCRRHTSKPVLVWPRWPGLRTDLASLLASNLVWLKILVWL